MLNIEKHTLSQLDTVLVCLWNNQDKRLFFKDIAELLSGDELVSFSDLDPILKKLEKEGYIEYDDRAVPFNDSGSKVNRVFRITFDGRFWTERGGYLGQAARQTAENTRAETLERFQMANASRMTYLTIVLAVGTTLAAVYYCVELYWNHGWFHFWPFSLLAN